MEAIISIVGFLGAGKTTLLKQLFNMFSLQGWKPKARIYNPRFHLFY